jgi:hypothetical protein
MKTFATMLLMAFAVNRALSQQLPTILFANNATSLVYNALSGTPVRNSNGIHALLYYAPAGTSDESAFISLDPSVLIGQSPVGQGRFNGGQRSFPPGVGASGAPLSIQIRAFETNYGHNYEAAFAAGPINGRRALVGKSAIAQIVLGGGAFAPRDVSACGGFTVDVAGGGPYLSANDLVVAEGSNGVAFAHFKISLLNTQNVAVSVDFTTADGTALAGSDYVATNGTLVFAPGEKEKIVTVALTPDVPAEPDEEFYLDLSNVVNGIVTRPRLRCVITEVRITGISVDVSVSFNTVANRRYMVERSLDFVTWQSVAGATNVLGTGGIVTAIDRGNGCASSVLYRATVIEE